MNAAEDTKMRKITLSVLPALAAMIAFGISWRTSYEFDSYCNWMRRVVHQPITVRPADTKKGNQQADET